MTAAPPPPADPLEAATHPDPRAYYAALAAQPALTWDPRREAWIAAGAGAVCAALHHPGLRVRPPHEPVPPPLLEHPGLAALYARLIRMTDGPAREPVRRAVAEALGALEPATAHALARHRAAALVPAAPREGAALTAFTFALPLGCVGVLLGLGEAELEDAVPEAQLLVAALSPLATSGERASGERAAHALETRLRTAGGGPLLQALRRAPGVSEEVALANAVGLLVQTCEATAGLIGQGLLALGTDASAALPEAHPDGALPVPHPAMAKRTELPPAPPDRRRNTEARGDGAQDHAPVQAGSARVDAALTHALLQDPRVQNARRSAAEGLPRSVLGVDQARVDAALTHALLETPPVQNTRRYAAEDLTLLGTPVRAGQLVLVLLAAANQDPAAPAHPRPDVPGHAFGLGAHACPGATLALTLARAALLHLLEVGLELGGLASAASLRPSLNGRIPRFTGRLGAEVQR
ncbi:hypothetical protein FGE12_23575 [Aggregicoccus sp. 17bor-14]|uniref:hypothetical protein n=1 Tax=Myxococcaceae TaxID=31 RepID=UPI0012EF0CF5|nr:hypothetical protein [Simulacricoccus sp. 17bor-14]MRI91148.1 hypothetical protein [Aggregicoccus sp. 17bor-14]